MYCGGLLTCRCEGIVSLHFYQKKIMSHRKISIFFSALVVLSLCIIYHSSRYLGENFSRMYQHPVEMAPKSKTSHIVTENRNILLIKPDNISGSEHVICDNLSNVSISRMRAVSAQWQQIKDNSSWHVYSAFWETRMTLKEVRVIGMSHLNLTVDGIWCQLWYEGQGHPLSLKAIKLGLQMCPKCKT